MLCAESNYGKNNGCPKQVSAGLDEMLKITVKTSEKPYFFISLQTTDNVDFEVAAVWK